MITNEDIKNYFNKLKIFKNIDDIPEIPLVKDKDLYNEVIIKNLIRCGAIPKKDLVIGAKYAGSCRNSSEAVWNGKCFEIKRYKWGIWEDDTLNHFEDDNGFDLFIPIKKIKDEKKIF